MTNNPKSVNLSGVIESIIDLAVEGRVPLEELWTTQQMNELLGLSPEAVTLRATLSLLALEGCLRNQPRVGWAFRKVTFEEAEETVRHYCALQTVAVHSIVEWEPDGKAWALQQLRNRVEPLIAQLLQAALENQLEQFTKLEARFHIGLAAAAGLTTSAQSIRGYLAKMRLYRINHPMAREQMLAISNACHEILTRVYTGSARQAVEAIDQYTDVVLNLLPAEA